MLNLKNKKCQIKTTTIITKTKKQNIMIGFGFVCYYGIYLIF